MKAQRTFSSGTFDLTAIQRWLELHGNVLSGNISYGSTMSNSDQDMNMNVFKASGTSPSTANAQFALTHTLGRVPVTIVGQDTLDGSVIYRGSTAWTKTTVYLASTGASTVYNVIIA